MCNTYQKYKLYLLILPIDIHRGVWYNKDSQGDSPKESEEEKMAKATAVCTCAKCGKEFVCTNILQSRSAANDWENWASTHYTVCGDCYQAELAEKRQEENAEAARKNAEMGLPSLTGSEKQIAWAEKLRSDFIAAASELEKEYEKLYERARRELGEAAEPEIEKMQKILAAFRAEYLDEASAKVWIDKRGSLDKLAVTFRDYASARI